MYHVSRFAGLVTHTTFAEIEEAAGEFAAAFGEAFEQDKWSRVELVQRLEGGGEILLAVFDRSSVKEELPSARVHFLADERRARYGR